MFVEYEPVVDSCVPREVSLNVLAPVAPSVAPCSAFVSRSTSAALLRVSRLDDQCRLTIADDLGNTADAGGHDGLSRWAQEAYADRKSRPQALFRNRGRTSSVAPRGGVAMAHVWIGVREPRRVAVGLGLTTICMDACCVLGEEYGSHHRALSCFATVERGPHGMKVAILAGGIGSRLSEETIAKPKPMVEIGGRPILWHIMKHYAHYGHQATS